MQRSREKYKFFSGCYHMMVVAFLLLVQSGLPAQEPQAVDSTQLDWADTARLDTAIASPVENDEEKDTVEAETEKEYFLRKEFTGGLPDTIKWRKLPDKSVDSFRDDKAFWYANHTFKKKQKKESAAMSGHPALQRILWLVIIGGFITFLLIYLANSNVGLFRKSITITEEEPGVETGDIFNINYQKEIDRAAGAGNYRLAIRLMFLRLLRDLADRNLIQYKQDNTNFDYMMQLQRSPVYNGFKRLARNYEYSWYGQFDIDKEKYTLIKSEFENFDQRMSR